MRSFIHFLSLKGIQEDVNKSFPVAMDNVIVKLKDVPELS